MRVLFDNGTPRGIAGALLGHAVEEARSHGWDALRNGELLDAAEAAGFDVLVILGNGRWRLVRARLPDIAAAVNTATPGRFTEVEIPFD
ncbi:MAG: hypothetical protein HY824_09990 [Acidobacteria bacterium]|nr:hypothetical protein [Acidobacteriota bacterium]